MSRRISPATVLAAIALFVALGGAAYAGSKIGSSDIEKGAITSEKLAKGAVIAKAIAKDAVTGKAVKESSLKTVPSAATAGGLTPTKFSSRLAESTPLATVATIGTLRLQFGCNASGIPQVSVLPASGAPAQTTRTSVLLQDNKTKTSGQGTLPPAGIVVLDGTENTSASFNGTIDSLTLGGDVITIQWAARSTANFPSANPDEFNCLFWGTSLAG